MPEPVADRLIRRLLVVVRPPYGPTHDETARIWSVIRGESAAAELAGGVRVEVDGAVLVLLGLMVGGALSVAATRALQPTLREASQVPAALPWLTAAVLIATALAASVIPARRATRISPVDVMRSE